MTNPDTDLDAGPEPQSLPADLILGITLIAILGLRIIMIFFTTCPFWDLCIVLVPIGWILWPALAILLAIKIAAGAIRRRSPPFKRLRALVAFLLILLAADASTGGNYRWFELAMRYRMAKVGGSAALQAWAQTKLGSSEQVAALDTNGGGFVDPSEVPPPLQHWFGHFGPTYRMSNFGGPLFVFDDGGWDMGWGVAVGRTDMKDPIRSVSRLPDAGWPINWTKCLQPGVYLYAHQ